MNLKPWASLHSHTDSSLLDAISKPKKAIQTAENNGLYALAMTDHGNISSCVDFIKASQKSSVKPILGCEFYLGQPDKSASHLVVLAKNLEGWKQLIKAVSRANLPDRFYRKPRLFLEDFGEYAGNLITFSGHPGSDLANIIFKDLKSAYRAKSVEEAKKFVDPDWVEKSTTLANKYIDIFGRENFFLEIQAIDIENLPMAELVVKGLRYIAKKNGFQTLATADSHYPNHEDARDQRVSLCINLQTTIQEVEYKLRNDEDVGLGGFFRSNNYHIPTLEEMNSLHTEEELENSIRIADICERYDILRKPSLPQFPCPNGLTDDEYLRQLCRKGWNEKIKGNVTDEDVYAARVKMELEVLQGAGLSSYFLIVQDYVNWAKSQGQLVGYARGSAGGCLVSALLNIIGLDPLPYDLIFERFYNAGRNTADHISYPDIDVDFPVEFRGKVIDYIKEKYGKDNVAQMATFGRLMGRGCVKDVLRVHNACSFDEMNRITEHIPDEASIADELEEMKQDGEDPSIVKWALINNAKELSEWCRLEDDGSLSGSFSQYFAQAMRLEGTKRSQGKHAAGIVISVEPLNETVPMLYDKHTGNLIAGLDMNSCESLGMVKMDILSTAVLSKIQGAAQILGEGCVG